jgi:hypothetical protein
LTRRECRAWRGKLQDVATIQFCLLAADQPCA